jgi:hypothetical protein
MVYSMIKKKNPTKTNINSSDEKHTRVQELHPRLRYVCVCVCVCL